MTNTDDSWDPIINQLAALDWLADAANDAGLVASPERKAYLARRDELIARIDDLRGTADATYATFRRAFEAGADCATLRSIRNAMHPKDPLKEAANADMREVGCVGPNSVRSDV